MALHEKMIKQFVPFSLIPIIISSFISTILLHLDYEGFIWLVIAMNFIVIAYVLIYAFIYIVLFIIDEFRRWVFGYDVGGE